MLTFPDHLQNKHCPTWCPPFPPTLINNIVIVSKDLSSNEKQSYLHCVWLWLCFVLHFKLINSISSWCTWTWSQEESSRRGSPSVASATAKRFPIWKTNRKSFHLHGANRTPRQKPAAAEIQFSSSSVPELPKIVASQSLHCGKWFPVFGQDDRSSSKSWQSLPGKVVCAREKALHFKPTPFVQVKIGKGKTFPLGQLHWLTRWKLDWQVLFPVGSEALRRGF